VELHKAGHLPASQCPPRCSATSAAEVPSPAAELFEPPVEPEATVVSEVTVVSEPTAGALPGKEERNRRDAQASLGRPVTPMGASRPVSACSTGQRRTWSRPRP